MNMVGLDHTITNPQLANEIVKISNEWKHSLRRWSKDHHDHCMQVAHIRLTLKPPQQQIKPITCSRLLQVYKDPKQHVQTVETAVQKSMGEHKQLFDTLMEAAQQTQWGDLPADGDAVQAAQRLTSAAYAIAVQALNQGNQDVLQALKPPKTHKTNGLEWAMSAATEAVHQRKTAAALAYEAQGKHMPPREKSAFDREAKAGAARDAEAWLNAEVFKLENMNDSHAFHKQWHNIIRRGLRRRRRGRQRRFRQEARSVEAH